MASTYTTNLRLTKQGDGENPNSWGQILNDGVISLADEAIAGYTTISIGSAATVNLTANDGADDQSRSAFLEVKGSIGTVATSIFLVIPNKSKSYSVLNKVSANAASNVVMMRVAGNAGVTISRSSTQFQHVVCDGTSVRNVAQSEPTFSTLEVTGAATFDSTVTVSGASSYVGAATFYSTAHFLSHSNLPNDNAVLIGTVAKGTAPTGSQGTLGIYSNDAAAAQLQGTITLVGSSTASERRLVISNIEQGVGYRNITLAESGGNVGIGTSAPAVKLDVNGIAGWGGATTGQTAQIVGTNSPLGNGGNLRVLSNTTQATNIGGSLVLGGYYTAQTNSIGFGEIGGRKENATAGNTAGYLAFGTRPNGGNMTESMRIDSVGRVLIGQTASTNNGGKLEVTATGTNAADFAVTDSSYALVCSNNGSAGGLIYFNYNTNNVGTITTDGSNTTYATSSDYRLKENVEYDWDATTRLKQLKPARFNFLANPDNTVDGFMAHEAQEVVPESVTGFKDEVDDEGKPVMQGIDQAKLVPLLVKTILELEARITALEG